MNRFLSAILAALLILALAACGSMPPARSDLPPAASSSHTSSGAASSEVTLPPASPADGSASAETPADPAPVEPPADPQPVTPPVDPEPVPDPIPEPEPTPEPDSPTLQELAREQVAAMPLVEKVGQLFFARCPTANAAADVATYHLGGYILFGRDFKDKTSGQIIDTVASYQAAAEGGIPLLMGVDEEGGSVVRVSSNPNIRSKRFPSPQKLYAGGGMAAVAADTWEKDAVLRSLGINVNLAPVADVSTDPADFIYARSFGRDAAATSDYVRTVVAQMAADRMGSVLKHFPGYGSNADTHTDIVTDPRPMETFLTSDFLPFAAGIEAGSGTASVLVSHNIVTAMDPTLPASLSPAVHSILRDQLAFDGVIMTDDLAMDAVSAYAADGSAAILALLAGNDMIITSDHRTHVSQVVTAVVYGRLPESVIDEACARVLVWKHHLGLLTLTPAP